MKILWFTNTPSLAEDYLNNKIMTGGFIKSLEKVMQDKVDLSIAFYHTKELSPFKYKKTTYFPIKKNSNSLLYKVKTRVLNQIEPKNDLKKFIKIIEEIKPDLIHIHGTEGPFGLVQNHTTIPTVISIQGNISAITQKYFSGISVLNIFKYSKFRSWLFFNTSLNYFPRFKKQALRG
jgi:hypothetical protein